MLVENDPKGYVIIKTEDGFVDTNGCYYRKLTEPQRHICGKTYFYHISTEEGIPALEIKKIVTDVEKRHEKDPGILFREIQVASYSFKDGCICGDSSIDFNDILVNSRNPELFFSYIFMIVGQKDYYNAFLDWLDYTITDKNGIHPDVYVYVFYAFVTGKDGIIAEMLKKDMKKTLYDFCDFII